MGFEILLTVLFVLLLANFVSLDLTISKMKKDRLNIDVVAAIVAIETAVKKLSEKLRCETQSLSDYKQRLKRLEKRIDILEEGHPDTDIDYGEVDDHGEVVCVWFEGKKYVPEDKRNDIDYVKTDGDGNILAVWFHGKKFIPEDKKDEDTYTFYADGRVVAETTRPDPHPESRYKCSDCVRFRRERIDGKWRGICSVDNVIMSDDEQYICDKFRLYKPTCEITKPEETRCCATCQFYRPGEGHTCALCYWLNVTKTRAATPESACHNYEKAYAATKGEVDHLYTQYKNMGGNGRAEELSKYIVKLNYLASDDECDELLKRVERLNRIYDAGLLSLSEYGEMLKGWMQNDT